MVLHSLPVVFCRGGSCCCSAAWNSFEHAAVVCYWCIVLLSTDRTSHGAGAGCFPQHTQETGYMSAGAGRQTHREETWKCPLHFKLPGTPLCRHLTVRSAWTLFLCIAEKAPTDSVVTSHARWREPTRRGVSYWVNVKCVLCDFNFFLVLWSRSIICVLSIVFSSAYS